MSIDKNPASNAAPARPSSPASAAPFANKPKPPATAPDATKAEPVPHERPPVRSDDN